MSSNETQQKLTFTNLGLIGAAFGCMLVIFSLSEQSSSTETALLCFSVSIPVGLTSEVIKYIQHESDNKYYANTLKIIGFATFAIGQIGGFIGIYHLFLHTSVVAARHFGDTVLICYIASAVLLNIGQNLGNSSR